MPKKTRDGYVFYEDHHYLQKVGTREFFIYTKELAARDDMVIYNPFATDHTKEIKMGPDDDHASLHSDKTKEFSGYSREEIRDITKEMNRTQRILWAIDILFQKLPIHDLTQFAPSRVDIMKIIGPPVSGSDLIHAVDKYKANPTNIKALIAEAAIAPPPDPEDFVLIKEPEPDDPITTTDAGSQ
jgi:hypothetical protein